MDPLDILNEEVKRLRDRSHAQASDILALQLKKEEEHTCAKLEDWGKLMETLKFCVNHVSEGDSPGGFRDRLLQAEETIKQIKGIRALAISTLITVIFAVIGTAITWGEIRRQVKVDTERLDRIETILFVNGRGGESNFIEKK